MPRSLTLSLAHVSSLSFRLYLPTNFPTPLACSSSRFPPLPPLSSHSFSHTLFPFSGFANRPSGHDHTDGYRDSSRFSRFFLFFFPFFNFPSPLVSPFYSSFYLFFFSLRKRSYRSPRFLHDSPTVSSLSCSNTVRIFLFSFSFSEHCSPTSTRFSHTGETWIVRQRANSRSFSLDLGYRSTITIGAHMSLEAGTCLAGGVF